MMDILHGILKVVCLVLGMRDLQVSLPDEMGMDHDSYMLVIPPDLARLVGGAWIRAPETRNGEATDGAGP